MELLTRNLVSRGLILEAFDLLAREGKARAWELTCESADDAKRHLFAIEKLHRDANTLANAKWMFLSGHDRAAGSDRLLEKLGELLNRIKTEAIDKLSEIEAVADPVQRQQKLLAFRDAKPYRAILRDAQRSFADARQLYDEAVQTLFSGPYSPATPPAKPRILIASFVEGLAIARLLKERLYKHLAAEIEVWDEPGVFRLGGSTMEGLEKALDRYQFGVFLFTSHDRLIARGSSPLHTGDVLFQLGLFIGRHTRNRSFVIHPSTPACGNFSNYLRSLLGGGAPPPRTISDLEGISFATYDPAHPEGSLDQVCQKIHRSILKAQALGSP